MDCIERMGKVKTNLLLKQPFYGVLLSMIDLIEEKSFPTMATDGHKIYWNKEFVEELTDAELLGVSLHEVNHCIYFHMDKNRIGTRDRQIWNVAADYVINQEILGMGYQLPKGGCFSEEFKNDTVEQAYDKLFKKAPKCPTCKGKGELKCDGCGGGGKDKDKQDGKGQGKDAGEGKGDCEECHGHGTKPCPDCDGTGLGGKTMDTHIINEKDFEAMKEKILTAHEASILAQGTVPAGVQRIVDELKKAKVRWERIFHRYVGNAIARDDYSFSRPNRRYMQQGIYLPDLKNHIIGNVWVAIDTSGSVGKDDLSQMGSELVKIGSLINEVTAITCDAEVHEIVKLNKFEHFRNKLKFKGGGGTDFRPVFDKINELKEAPELVIFLTDTQGTFPDKQPKYPVLWVSTIAEGKVPWGQIVYMK